MYGVVLFSFLISSQSCKRMIIDIIFPTLWTSYQKLSDSDSWGKSPQDTEQGLLRAKERGSPACWQWLLCIRELCSWPSTEQMTCLIPSLPGKVTCMNPQACPSRRISTLQHLAPHSICSPLAKAKRRKEAAQNGKLRKQHNCRALKEPCSVQQG